VTGWLAGLLHGYAPGAEQGPYIQPNEQTAVFEEYRYGNVATSFFLNDGSPGGGPSLHRHPYSEVLVIQEGCTRFTVGAGTLEVSGSQIVVVPPGLPHKFVNIGDGPLRQVDIHPVGQMVTEWLGE
jgi:mannose-6-phosphate isomerase-like protein (cupin superfamily)